MFSIGSNCAIPSEQVNHEAIMPPTRAFKATKDLVMRNDRLSTAIKLHSASKTGDAAAQDNQPADEGRINCRPFWVLLNSLTFSLKSRPNDLETILFT